MEWLLLLWRKRCCCWCCACGVCCCCWIWLIIWLVFNFIFINDHMYCWFILYSVWNERWVILQHFSRENKSLWNEWNGCHHFSLLLQRLNTFLLIWRNYNWKDLQKSTWFCQKMEKKKKNAYIWINRYYTNLSIQCLDVQFHHFSNSKGQMRSNNETNFFFYRFQFQYG